MPVHTAALRHRVTLQSRAAGQDAAGQQLDTWVDTLACWAEITRLGGRELIAAQAVAAEATHQVRMRYAPGLTAAMRIVYGSRIFAIAAPPDDVAERHREILILATEGLAST